MAVNDLVFLVADSLDEEAQNAYIALDRIRDIATTNEHASLVLESFLKPIVLAQAKVELIAMPMMQYIMFSILALRVFHPTSLAGPDAQDANQYLQYIQNCVAAHGVHDFTCSSQVISSCFARRASGEVRSLASNHI